MSEWREIDGAPGYLVSDDGRVRSPWKERALHADAKGYMRVSIPIHGKWKWRPVHVLLMEAFVGPRPNKKYVCHWDGVPSNNRLENLRWGTTSENYADMVRHGKDSRRTSRVLNSTGLVGVVPCRKRWAAHIKVNGKSIYLGMFDTPEEAHAAYLEAKVRATIDALSGPQDAAIDAAMAEGKED